MLKNTKYLTVRYLSVLIITLSAFLQQGCKKFVEISAPVNQISGNAIFSDSASAIAAITGIYGRMMESNSFASGGFNSITALGGISADELVNYSPDINQAQFYSNTLSSTNSVNNSLWDEIYQDIYTSNLIIEGLDQSKNLSGSTKMQLTGEAEFIRAFCYFYLVNLYGPVPLTTSTNYLVNAKLSRSPVNVVYRQIITDLVSAATLLPVDYSFAQGERIRPTEWAADFLLARAYLFTQDWADAETSATLVISNTQEFGLVQDLNAVFLADSREAVWQLMPVMPGYNTKEGAMFILTGAPYNYSLQNDLVNSFPAGDRRRTDWIDSIVANGQTYYYPFKYKVQSAATVTEYSMVFRLAELYLLRAEARAQQNNISGAQEDLNMIRNRAGLPNTNADTKESLLNAIQNERKLELFTEWGHRWLDLKRNGQANAVLGALKGSGWNPNDTLYPIPQTEILNDPNLTQNTGY